MLLPESMSRIVIVGTKTRMEDAINAFYSEKAIHVIDHTTGDDGLSIGSPIQGTSKASERLLKIKAMEKELGIKKKTKTADIAVEDVQKRIADGEVVELVSDMGRDRVRVETTPYLHPACIFTSAAPGGRSFGADAGGAQALGVGPLDHTPLRWDPLTGAALTQENAVRVEKIVARGDNDE